MNFAKIYEGIIEKSEQMQKKWQKRHIKGQKVRKNDKIFDFSKKILQQCIKNIKINENN